MTVHKQIEMAQYLTEDVRAVVAAMKDHDGGDYIDEIEGPILELAKALDEYRSESAAMAKRTWSFLQNGVLPNRS